MIKKVAVRSSLPETGRKSRSRAFLIISSASGVAYPVFAFLAIVAVWQAVVTVLHVSIYIVPAPSDVFRALVGQWATLLSNTWPTLVEILLGFVLGGLIGVPLAIIIVAWRQIARATYPLVVGFQGIPKVALAPMMIVWLGFGLSPKVVLAALIAFFPIVIDTISGLRSIDVGYIALVRSMGAGKFDIYRRVLLPNALPSIFGGFKIAMSFAVIGSIVAELVGANSGLGYLLNVGTGNLDMPFEFAVVLWLAVINIVLIAIIDILERILVPWSHHSRARVADRG